LVKVCPHADAFGLAIANRPDTDDVAKGFGLQPLYGLIITVIDSGAGGNTADRLLANLRGRLGMA
jgi:hypothetical protein